MSRLVSSDVAIDHNSVCVRGLVVTMTKAIRSIRHRAVQSFAAFLLAMVTHASGSQTNSPPAEQLLPPDTLLVISTPDFTKLRAIYEQSPQVQFWNDLAMKPFRDKFMTKLKDEFVVPLERDLGVKFADFGPLLQGQLTLAVTQDGWQGKKDESPAFLLLLDTKENSEQLRKTLSDLRRKWVDAGKPI